MLERVYLRKSSVGACSCTCAQPFRTASVMHHLEPKSTEFPETLHEHRTAKSPELVPRGGIEPPTRGIQSHARRTAADRSAALPRSDRVVRRSEEQVTRQNCAYASLLLARRRKSQAEPSLREGKPNAKRRCADRDRARAGRGAGRGRRRGVRSARGLRHPAR